MPDDTDQLRAALRAACQEVERQRRVIHALETAIWRLAEIANADAETGGLPAGNAVIRVAEGKPMPGDIEMIAEGAAGEPAG